MLFSEDPRGELQTRVGAVKSQGIRVKSQVSLKSLSPSLESLRASLKSSPKSAKHRLESDSSLESLTRVSNSDISYAIMTSIVLLFM